jgi:hypothetical protein
LAAVRPDEEDATATSVDTGLKPDSLLDGTDKAGPLTLPAPGALSAGTETPLPITLETPPPIVKRTPLPEIKTPTPAPLFGDASETGTPGPILTPRPILTPGPVMTKTPAPLTKRDPSSLLPSIPAARKEPSGAFPLPGMAPPDAAKSSDEDATLIARLSVLDDLAEESTKVEEIDEVLRAASQKKEEPIALSDQATAEREKALSVSPAERAAAAEFEEPGDDDMTISATPGIISISDEDEDDEEPTASQRPPGAHKTPTPPTGGPRLQTPLPVAVGGPRLPAPTPPPGRSIRLPTPSGGLPPIPMPLASPASAPQRAITPALPIPAPQGAPAPAVSSVSATILKKYQMPLVALVAFLASAFGAGFIAGAWLFGGQPAATPVAVQAPAAPAPTVVPTVPAATAPTPSAEKTAAATEKTAAATAEKPAAAAEPAPAEKPAAPAPAEQPALEANPVVAQPAPAEAPAAEPALPVRHVAPIRPKPPVHKPAPPAAVAAKPPANKPAAPAGKPAAKPATASAKPAAAPAKGGKSGKAWVDPFAE